MKLDGLFFTLGTIALIVCIFLINDLWAQVKRGNTYCREMQRRISEWKYEVEATKREMQEERRSIDKSHRELDERQKMLDSIQGSMLEGRKWLAKMISKAYDEKEDSEWYLRFKNAPKSADIVKAIKEKNKLLIEKNAFLESQLEAYKEYFPFLDELEEDILEEKEDFRGMTKEDFGNIDPVRKLLSRNEWENLSSIDRNQLAMDRYLQKTNKIQIGKMYERYIGWLFEKEGKLVEYTGLRDGLEDRGRDLLVSDPCSDKVTVVQAKCWSTKKTIHEKHIFQLFGSIYELAIANPDKKYFGLFVTTTELSPFAKIVAKKLGIVVAHRPLDKTFPMIKCNISKSGERIYHLPFDQQYDKTKISSHGEFMARTVKEAEEKGFRRAHRHSLNK
jgi:hypothetical protein